MKNRLDPHGRFRELLAARLDRTLTRAESRLLATHLRTCPGCKQVEREYRDQRALLRSLPTPVPPRDMWARTSTALDREMSRWPYRYPRVGRRLLTRVARSRSGAPSALATVVAAMGVVTVIAVMQLGPALQPEGSPPAVANASVGLRPTPIAVAPQPLAVVSTGESDLTVYQTLVGEVCPTTAPDCFDEREFVRRTVSLPNLRPQNVAMSPTGSQIAFVGHNTGRDVITVVFLRDDAPRKTPKPRETDGQQPTATPTVTLPPPSTPAASETPGASETPDVEPSPTETPAEQTPDPPSQHPDPTDTPPASTPTTEPAGTPAQIPTLGEAPSSPPASAVPGLTVLSILEDVHSAGAPPAWSTDGEVLAFSAMPADGSTGPDVYVWRPTDEQATPITTDHASYFASWSGRRIVASRIIGATGKSETLGVETVVIDPETLEERRVGGPDMWLPVVDPEREQAVVWSGELDLTGALPSIVSGALYLVDWSTIDPYAGSADGGTDAVLTPIHPSRDAVADPVLDWHARWSNDSRVLGVWEADAPGASLGHLVVVAFDPESGLLDLDEPLFETDFAKRGFTLGADRVAWVGPSRDGTEGELRIRAWGTDGVGDLRLDTFDLEELVPSF